MYFCLLTITSSCTFPPTTLSAIAFGAYYGHSYHICLFGSPLRKVRQLHKPERFTLHKNVLIAQTGKKGILKQSTVPFQSKSFPLNWMANSCERCTNNQWIQDGIFYWLPSTPTILTFFFWIILHIKWMSCCTQCSTIAAQQILTEL